MKILLLEDDPLLGETVAEMLGEAHYDVHWVKDGEEAAEATFYNTYDLYLLDINVPKINGFQLLEELREAGDSTRVIFISALSDIGSVTRGFRLGAEDYLKKPFFPEELLVRIDAKLIRFHNFILHGEISFNPQNNEVTKNGHPLSVGEVQLPLLHLFIRNIGITLPKERLFDLMEHPSDSALRVAINKLKHTTDWDIRNIRGVGYRLETR
ncbi:MAG: response regulator transcription factor [Sulfuricurvum sp.]|uniref:response regulator transcription factor n=1 Tax=Sulfuricurvum sp. TaxID=2025608 RepID=UPI0025EA7D20|nr:response regulator transcription factor [Sulfuricurvum sp.]MCK9373962.1 response regulator transcription factor [Sulfuricurvum sp.]